jgi:hypothetical protein
MPAYVVEKQEGNRLHSTASPRHLLTPEGCDLLAAPFRFTACSLVRMVLCVGCFLIGFVADENIISNYAAHQLRALA